MQRVSFLTHTISHMHSYRRVRVETPDPAAVTETKLVMGSPDQKKPVAGPAEKAETPKPGDPQWTTGLKRLYDSVVDEPLPDSFKDLLSKLDDGGSK